MNQTRPGKLVILSGPSGAGKSTVLTRVLAESDLPLVFSVSATTRSPRQGEETGVQYHFLSHEEFAVKKENREFLECKEVFGQGNWYGTLASEVEKGIAIGNWVVLEIDVQGTDPISLRIFLLQRS